MNYLILIVVLLIGSFCEQILAKLMLSKISNEVLFYLVNAVVAVVFFAFYFLLVGLTEAKIYGASGMYDVEAVIFLAFGLASSLVSSRILTKDRSHTA